MASSDYYPAGAYNDPNAPYNQKTIEPIDVNADVTITLQNTLTVTTDNYAVDEDGIDLLDKYSDIEELISKQHNSIPAMLTELEKYINKELADGCSTTIRRWYLERMLEDCRGWEQTELEVDDFNKC